MEIIAKLKNIAHIRYALAVFFFWASMYLYVPTLPVYIQGKVTNLTMVGIILSMYGLWQGLVRFPLGILADRLGQRKPFVMLGFGFSAAGALLMANASGGMGLLLGRAVTGLAAGCWVTLVVLFSNLYPPEDSMYASTVINALNSAGMLAATAMTGWLNNLGGSALAFNLAVGLALLAFLFTLPNPEVRTPPQRRTLNAIKNLVMRRDVLLPSLLGALLQYAVWATTFSFTPLLAKQFGASDVLQSILLSLNIAIILLGNLVVSRLVVLFGALKTVNFSFVLMAVGVGVGSIARSLELVFLAQFCTGFALGVGFPLLMGLSIKNVDIQQRSTAMGFFQAIYASGMFSGAWLSGFLAEALGIQVMFGFTALLCLVLGVAGTHRISREKSAN